MSEVDILANWSQAMTYMEHIPSEMLDMYKLKMGCRNWREIDMKTGAWKVRILNIVVTLCQLEKRFNNKLQ